MLLNPTSSKLRILLFILFVSTLTTAMGQHFTQNPLSERLTSYEIQAELDTESKMIHGKMLLSYRNPSQDTLSELQFHLYMNAFRNDFATWHTDRKTHFRDVNAYGYIDITSCSLDDDRDVSNMSFIQTDEPPRYSELRIPDEVSITPENQERDRTVMSIPLERGLLPDSTIRVQMDFKVKLPKLVSRSGYSDNYYFIAQWFPKLGVYEPAGMRGREKGGWNTHQFHSSSEFYANHGNYVVSITLPQNYQVGTGGKLVHEEPGEDGNKTMTFLAEDLVDFAWTASQDYMIAEGQWRHVSIRCLLQPEHYDQAERHIQSAIYALQYLDEHVGPYPWDYLTIVDPPAHGQSAGGMEYTTLITAGTYYHLPKGLRMPEMVTVHEFGHAYFMGILANNEFEEAWLDEGINTYWEGRIMDWAYGDQSAMLDFPFLRAGDVEFARIAMMLMSNKRVTATHNNAWQFPPGTYGIMVYHKPATMLHTLERMVGQECMDEIFKAYYRQWSFKHPSSEDFISVVNQVVSDIHGNRFGESLNWFFDQFLYGNSVLDYRIRSISVYSVYEPGGWMQNGSEKELIKPVKQDEMYRSVVRLERMAEGIIPVEVLVHFENGEEILETWDGKDWSRNYEYITPSPVIWAHIDPEQKLLLDVDLMNNSYTREPARKPVWKLGAKFLFFIQSLMQMTSLFS